MLNKVNHDAGVSVSFSIFVVNAPPAEMQKNRGYLINCLCIFAFEQSAYQEDLFNGKSIVIY